MHPFPTLFRLLGLTPFKKVYSILDHASSLTFFSMTGDVCFNFCNYNQAQITPVGICSKKRHIESKVHDDICFFLLCQKFQFQLSF